MEGNLLAAFGLTLFAGLATGLGSAIAFFARRTNTKFLSIALGFSAGVMIYVSFVEIFAKARMSLVADLGTVWGTWSTVAGFFAGMFFAGLIDKFVPSYENPHEPHKIEEMADGHKHKLMRMGVFAALAIAIHNFPEGIATFLAALQDLSLGIPLAIAIAIHNIPEGIAVSVPIFYATGKRGKAFLYSFLSGLTEPVGAVIGYVLLVRLLPEAVFGVVFASVAGIMVFISLDQLLPAAREYGEHHLSMYGLLAGMIIMAVSLLLFI